LHEAARTMNRRRKTPILVSVLALTLLSLIGRPLAAKPNKPRDMIEVEILEYQAGSKKPTRERTLTVPVSGEVASWTDLFDEVGQCSLESEPIRDELVSLDLYCATRKGNVATLQLKVERVFVLDEPTLVAVVDTQGDRRIEIVATRR
jgi:hypothetical protein